MLFPFKSYIILVPIVFLLLQLMYGTPPLRRLGILSLLTLIIDGDILCIIVLIIGGVFIAVLTRDWKTMRSALIYAAVGFLLLTFILPALELSK